MRRWITIPLAVLVVVATLAVTVGTSTADHLSVSSGSWRIVWPQVVFGEPGWTVTCRRTLGGTFHERTFVKEAFTNMASANEGSIAGRADAGFPAGRRAV